MYFCRTMWSMAALLVNYASTGVGLGMSDVAMHLHHAVLPEDLANGGEEAWSENTIGSHCKIY
jgi:hypothetical protein